jgi:CheY-like chemotaxis protein
MAKIMLVEDDNNLREIYGERLQAEGYEIVSAGDGEEGLSTAIKERPDLIISDVMMPKISGFDMLDILRQTPETMNTKVIMMTALSQTEDKDRATKLGADKYLVKSQVTLEDVARAVHELLNDSTTPAVETTTTSANPVISSAPMEMATAPMESQPSPVTSNDSSAPTNFEPTPAPVTPGPEAPAPGMTMTPDISSLAESEQTKKENFANESQKFEDSIPTTPVSETSLNTDAERPMATTDSQADKEIPTFMPESTPKPSPETLTLNTIEPLQTPQASMPATASEMMPETLDAPKAEEEESNTPTPPTV